MAQVRAATTDLQTIKRFCAQKLNMPGSVLDPKYEAHFQRLTELGEQAPVALQRLIGHHREHADETTRRLLLEAATTVETDDCAPGELPQIERELMGR